MVLHVPLRTVAPRPELLARNHIVVGNAHDPRILPVVVPGHEVVRVVPRKHAAGGRVVFVPAHVHPFGVVRAHVFGGGDGPRSEVDLGVIGDKLRAWRIDHLVVVIYMHRDVAEAQHRGRHRRPVAHAERRLQVRLPRTQRHAHRPLHAVAQLQFADPYGLGAVGVLLHLVLHRQEAGGAVVVWQVPLDPAGDPRAQQADQRRLDHMLVVDEVVAVGFVHRLEDLAADLRQNPDLHILVFQIDHGVGLVFFLRRQIVVRGIGIDAVLRALRRSAEVELRIGVRLAQQVSRDDNLLLPHPHRSGLRRRCGLRRRRRRGLCRRSRFDLLRDNKQQGTHRETGHQHNCRTEHSSLHRHLPNESEIQCG